MKKKVAVTIEKEIEVDIPDEMLTEESLESFCQHFHQVDSVDELFEYAARYVARLDEAFVEGIGRIDYKELYEDVTTEIIEC